MKRILVPSDLSDISENALQMAADIADITKAEIFLVNFTDHPFGQTFTATGELDKKFSDEESLFTVQLIRKRHKDLEVLATKYGYGSDVRVINFEVYGEELQNGIDEYIKANSIDLVVMGTSGEESIDEIFSGNHAEQVIERASCPVITVKEKYVKSSFKSIVLGVDAEKDRHDNFTQAAALLKDLVEGLGAELHIVNVSKSVEDKVDTEKKISAFTTKHNILSNSITVVEADDIEEGLINFAHQKSASLLAVLTHVEDSFFRMFSHSLAEDLSMESDVPVLTINLHTI
ncbi:universal stress protein [Fulvivirga sediminis]|uniref:Universal stress protein n=1 Tax=Fulvivirga sediminis TaxID=2803949 RepID=A0A937FB10_9BACT|nr:universal stress protein [Fulvivirga sediminis]MBL3657570.1 universal stress protein [Fulvivirga sediminis]